MGGRIMGWRWHGRLDGFGHSLNPLEATVTFYAETSPDNPGTLKKESVSHVQHRVRAERRVYLWI